ncbi:SDR family oxidoreductase [Empedobacter brevis]
MEYVPPRKDTYTGKVYVLVGHWTGSMGEGMAVYSAAKSAVQSFIKTFAAEFTEKGIRVNGINPGHIKTNIFNNTGLNAEQIEGAIQNIIPTIPFKRLGEPAEIAHAVLFLASQEASYIHGTELTVDAGISVIRC